MKPTQPADAIMLTLPVMYFKDIGKTCDEFKHLFERYMQQPDSIWNFRLTNLPKQDVAWVYFVFDGQVQYRLNLVQYERNTSKVFKDGGVLREFPVSNWVILTGPVVKPAQPVYQRGFQGFRYCNQIF